MKYLMCIDSNGTESYYELQQGQEVRLTRLINEKRLPQTFVLNGKTVITKDILGFTDDKKSVSEQTSTKEGYERFRKSVMAQAWYQKAKGRTKPEPSHQLSPITLVP